MFIFFFKSVHITVTEKCFSSYKESSQVWTPKCFKLFPNLSALKGWFALKTVFFRPLFTLKKVSLIEKNTTKLYFSSVI